MSSKYIRSYEGNQNILLDMPHSGTLGLKIVSDIPEIIKSKLRFTSKAVRQTIGFGCDAAVPHMSDFLHLVALCDLSGVSNDLARVYCDVNRSRDEVSGLAVRGYDSYINHHGTIWSRTLLKDADLSLSDKELEDLVDESCERMFETPLSIDEFQTLMDEIYDPYHKALQEHHEKIVGKYGHCIHLALHSLPPISVAKVRGGYICGKKAARGPFDPIGNTLPDIILIHNNYQAAGKREVDLVRIAFESAGLIVEDGRGPFQGNDTGVTKIYGDPKNGIHVIGIEHVTHDTEPERHLGNPKVDLIQAFKYRPIYREAIENLLTLKT